MKSVAASPCKRKKLDSWDVEHAADVLIEAETIKADKVLYPLAKKELKKKAEAASKAALVAKVTAGLHKAIGGK